MTSFTVTRTFHPVGQGAFYSELFDLDGKRFLMVYDCGATNLPKPTKTLQREVQNSFRQDQYDSQGRLMVDILFLSHFHNDHLNGMSLLAPKKVVCPLVSDDDILMLQVLNRFEEEWNIAAIQDPATLFSNNPEIIRVEMIEEGVLEGRNTLFNLDNLPDVIPSGTRISVQSRDIDLRDLWYFIPFNFHYRGRLDEFKTKLANAKLSYDELKKDPHTYIKDNIRDLREISNSFTGNTNDQSLLLYSGPTTAPIEISYLGSDPYSIGKDAGLIYHACQQDPDLAYYLIRDMPIRKKRWLKSLLYQRNKPAAMYYGDITLSEDLVRSFTSGLTIHMDHVGTIQLPHHGSDRSFDESVLYRYRHYKKEEYEFYSVLFVMCASSKSNTHPGKNLMTTLSRCPQSYVVVKEHRSTAVTEKWRLKSSEP